MRIRMSSIMVDDQEKALHFYTEVLGFTLKRDTPTGAARFLTVVSPEEPDVVELLIEPLGFAPAQQFQQELFDAGIPLTAFEVEDVQTEYERLTKRGVVFRGEPSRAEGAPSTATFEDTCGNLIMIYEDGA